MLKVNRTYLCFLIFLLFFLSSFAYAWDCHFLLTYLALEQDPLLQQQAPVLTESLAQFVEKEKEGLVQVLESNEVWSQTHIFAYPPLPTDLMFANKQRNIPLSMKFIQALRINPLLTYDVFIQTLPNRPQPPFPSIERAQVMLPSNANAAWILIPNPPLLAVPADKEIMPIDVISSASDEPDYGMDINLWRDNPSWFGKLYQWGDQPFGNKTVEFGSQAPFHVGYFYESYLVTKIAPVVKHCYPEYRIHLYLMLSRFAFSTHHPYWGYRFLGWALHYIQDLTQPYHAKVAPNVAFARIFFVSMVDLIGWSSPRQNIIQLISNRHFSLENYQYFLLLDTLQAGSNHADIRRALSDTTADAGYPPYSDRYPREVVAQEAHARADTVDALIYDAFPKKYVRDSQYIFYTTELDPNLFKESQRYPNNYYPELNAQIAILLRSVGAHTRNLMKAVVIPNKTNATANPLPQASRNIN